MKLIELCAGSAAVSMHLLGAPAPASYLGGKRSWAPAIATLLHLTQPSDLLLIEPGPWGRTWQALRDVPQAVLGRLESWRGRGSRELWQELAALPVPAEPAAFAATFLHLQAGSFGGKPVLIRDGRWKTAGYANLTQSARERGFRERAPVRTTLERVRKATLALAGLSVQVACVAAEDTWPMVHEARGATVLFDPPYAGREGYGLDLPRAAVVAVAMRWAAAGAVVGVCEAEPIPELLSAGWQARRLWRTSRQPRTTMGAPSEWITTNAPLT